MSFKSTVFLIFTVFISACASSNIKSDSSSSTSLPLVIKDDIIYEAEAINLHRSEVALIYIGKFISVREINDKKVPIPFFSKEYRKFVTLPGTVSITFDYDIGAILGLPTYKGKLEGGKSYAFVAKEEDDVVYLALYDTKTKKPIRLFE